MPEDITDTQKLRLIPQLMNSFAELHKLIVTGDISKGEPGLLETIRNIAKDIGEIKKSQDIVRELERRVQEIEERHKILDAQKTRIDEQRKKWDIYQVAIFGTLFANIVTIIVNMLGWGR